MQDGLFPTVVTDEQGVALGLVYSNEGSIRAALQEGRGIFWSRSRDKLWRKGDSSGAIQVPDSEQLSTHQNCRVQLTLLPTVASQRQSGL